MMKKKEMFEFSEPSSFRLIGRDVSHCRINGHDVLSILASIQLISDTDSTGLILDFIIQYPPGPLFEYGIGKYAKVDYNVGGIDRYGYGYIVKHEILCMDRRETQIERITISSD